MAAEEDSTGLEGLSENDWRNALSGQSEFLGPCRLLTLLNAPVLKRPKKCRSVAVVYPQLCRFGLQSNLYDVRKIGCANRVDLLAGHRISTALSGSSEPASECKKRFVWH
jgi:hypothetical protein